MAASRAPTGPYGRAINPYGRASKDPRPFFLTLKRFLPLKEQS